MALFIYLAHLYGPLQLLALASLTRSIRWRTIPVAVAAGLSGAAFGVLLLQFGWTRLYAGAAGIPLSTVTTTASYTVDPVIEEIGKVLPLVLVLLVTRVRRQLTTTDLVVIAAGLGSGFGLAESLLRFGHGAAGAQWSDGVWVRSFGLNSVVIPASAAGLAAWLPVGASSSGLFGGSTVGINVHLVWSSLAGLGLGLLFRGGARGRLLAAVPPLVAIVDHQGTNALLVAPDLPGPLVSLFHLLTSLEWLYPLLALVVAGWLDRRRLAEGLAGEPSLRLEMEQPGKEGVLPGLLARLAQPWSLVRLWSFVLQRRAFAINRALAPADPVLDQLRIRLARTRLAIDAGQLVAPDAGPGLLSRLLLDPSNYLLFLVAAPALLYFVIGTLPEAASLQQAMAGPVPFLLLVLVLGGSMLWRAGQLAWSTFRLPRLIQREGGAAGLAGVLTSVATLGGLGFGAFSLARFGAGVTALQPVLTNAHLLDAIASTPLIASMMFGQGAMGLSAPALPMTGGGPYPPDWQHGAPTRPVEPDPHVQPVDPSQQPRPTGPPGYRTPDSPTPEPPPDPSSKQVALAAAITAALGLLMLALLWPEPISKVFLMLTALSAIAFLVQGSPGA